LDTKGSTAVFEIVVDDYAEIWVNGKAPFVLGQNGGTVAAGWNAPNRVVLTRNAQPGEKFQIAVFGINGPVSTHPDTYIWVRSATLDFYMPGRLSKAREVHLEDPLVVRLEGTNVQQGKDILASSGLPIIAANDLGDAARKIVAEVKKPVAA